MMSDFKLQLLTENGREAAPKVKEFIEKHDVYDYDEMKPFLFPKLTRRSLVDSLDDLIKKEYLDLYITYGIVIEMEQGNLVDFLVNDKILREWGVTENQLFNDSVSTAEEKYPVDICTIEDALGTSPGGKSFYVLSNAEHIQGASSILYGNVLSDLSEQLGSYFYLLPSSVHEMMVVPDSLQIDPKELQSMVADINVEVVAGQDPSYILSNNIYRFDADGLWIVR